jgi:hypothetical protein
MNHRNLIETVQLAVLGAVMFVVAVVAERRLARLVEPSAPSARRTAPA